MRESTTYQAILQEGIIEGRKDAARWVLLRVGTKRFGEPDVATVAAIEAIQDLDRLEAMGDRLLDLEIRNWDDLHRAP